MGIDWRFPNDRSADERSTLSPALSALLRPNGEEAIT
jgi:hypothetical protein